METPEATVNVQTAQPEAALPPRDHPIWQHWARTNPILAGMLRRGLPLTREQWLRNNYVLSDEGVPDPVPPETEASMPPPFRLIED